MYKKIINISKLSLIMICIASLLSGCNDQSDSPQPQPQPNTVTVTVQSNHFILPKTVDK